MNTVEVGDQFEDKCYSLIEHAIKNNRLGIDGSSARVFRKKKYYSNKRKKDIIFDLAIEVWPNGANRYSLLLIIECKNYRTKNVPVDDVEEFESKVKQVAGQNVKAIMISASSFQEGAFTVAESIRMMLIEAHESDYNIVLYRPETKRSYDIRNDEEKLIFNFIKDTLGLNKVSGFNRLSSEDIEYQAYKVLYDYNKAKHPIELSHFINYLKNIHDIKFIFTNKLISSDGLKLFGYCDVKNKTISIDKDIINTNRFSFVLGHELGHVFLHSNIKINQEYYQNFADSHYNFFADKHLLVNIKQWIEWQANKFSVSLFLPKKLFIEEFICFRKNQGIRNPNHIYLDDQIVNQVDFWKTIHYLSKKFNISQTSIKYRINELGLLIDNQKTKQAIDIARNIIKEV